MKYKVLTTLLTASVLSAATANAQLKTIRLNKKNDLAKELKAAVFGG